MAKTKKITSLYVVTDSENSYDNIGDIDGGSFAHNWLKDHISNHGASGLLKQIAWMNFQVVKVIREIDMEKGGADTVSTKNNNQ